MSNLYNLEELIESTDTWGIYDILLPFLLIFTMTYAILNRVNIFAKENKKANIIIALVIALTTVIAHITNKMPRGYDVIEVINTTIPAITLVIVAAISLLILISTLGGEETKGKAFAFYFSATAVGLMAIIFVNSAFPNASLAIPAVSILIIIFTIFKKGDAKEPGATVGGAIGVLAFVLILFTFGYKVGLVGEVPWWLESDGALILLIIVAILGSAIGFLTKE